MKQHIAAYEACLARLDFNNLGINDGSTYVDGIKFVINFDYPNSSEDYIHRIGRTGRSSSTGTSYAFFTPKDSRQARDLVSVLKEANQVVNPKLSEMAMRGGGGGGGNNRWGYARARGGGGGFQGSHRRWN